MATPPPLEAYRRKPHDALALILVAVLIERRGFVFGCSGGERGGSSASSASTTADDVARIHLVAAETLHRFRVDAIFLFIPLRGGG